MNALDKSQTHLDPDSLSYPGDIHTMQDDGSSVKNSQVGGWDKSPESYRTASTNLIPPPVNKETNKPSGPRRPNQHNQNHNRHNSNNNNRQNSNSNGGYKSQSHAPLNSFNLYDQAPDSSVIKSETLDINPLKLLSDANPGIEFTIESSSANDGGGGDSFGSGSGSGSSGAQFSSQYKDYPAWNAYPQSAHDVYEGQDSGSSVTNAQSQYATLPSAAYENGNPDPGSSYGQAQDYVPKDRPVSDLSDNYSPHGGGLSTDLTPPSKSAGMYKRQATGRKTRNEPTPLVELDGLSLFQDILKNEKAHGARSELYKALTS